jgi:hypothetical protein
MHQHEETQKDMRETFPFTITTKINYIGKNLTKEIKGSFNENNKLLMKKVKQDIRKWRDP